MNHRKRTITDSKAKRKKIAHPSTFIVSPSYARLQMNEIKEALNSREQRVPETVKGQALDWEWRTRDVTERNKELRRLVGLWQVSNRDLNTLFKQHQDLQDACRAGTTFLLPDRDGKAQLAWFPDLGNFPLPSQKKEALHLFVQFLVNPLSDKLRGPCARCDDYYLQNRVNNKTYCRRQCGARYTALASTQARRQEAKKIRLEAAQSAVIEWERNHQRERWDVLVAKKVSKCSLIPVTVKWVTRAVNNGELRRPSDE